MVSVLRVIVHIRFVVIRIIGSAKYHIIFSITAVNQSALSWRRNSWFSMPCYKFLNQFYIQYIFYEFSLVMNTTLLF